tara:strand:+ start:1319 stop:1651 length:333 start_codon:yes stop_codon:yes gene_type:complete
MAQLALNRFQTVTFQITTAEQTVYTAPTGYTAIVLYAHIANYSTSDSTVTMKHIRSGVETEIIKNANVPISEAFVPMSGKLVLETNDSIKISSQKNDTLKVILSLLETAN